MLGRSSGTLLNVWQQSPPLSAHFSTSRGTLKMFLEAARQSARLCRSASQLTGKCPHLRAVSSVNINEGVTKV